MMRFSKLLTSRRVYTLALVLSDILLINVAFALAYYVRYVLQIGGAVDPANNVPYAAFVPFVILLTALLLLVYRGEGVYRLRRGASWLDDTYNILTGTATGIILMIFLVFFYRPSFYSRIIFLYTGGFIVLLLGLSRLLKALLVRYWQKQGVGVARLLIVGVGEVGRTVMRALVANPELGFQIVGFVDDDPVKGSTDIGRFQALGGIDNLTDLVRRHRVNEVVITLPWQYHRKIMTIMAQCERLKVRARIVPDLFQMTINRMNIVELAGIPLIGVKEISISGVNRVVKRTVDLVVALTVLVLASPLLGLIALAIKLETPGPAIFKQERVGKGGARFALYKFRSMVEGAESKKASLKHLNEAEGPMFKIKNDPRQTWLGRLLRRLSLDELPQLYNVLRGEMSLIGPRPNVPDEVESYQEWHKRRLEVSPGITGLWQVSGRSDLTFDDMALLDIYYIENWSLGLDAKILLRTIPRVLLGDGAY
jgi:exopolysaccharide biosynthesis polyprenyl glycosylphosphotransferase